MAYEVVLNVQGKGSGFDIAAAVWGGTLYFVTGGKAIEPLPQIDLPIMIGYSGTKVGTVNLVEQVYQMQQRHPKLINAIFDSAQMIVEEARDAFVNSDWTKFGELVDINQGLLDALGVNTPALSNLIFSSRSAGAFGAKLSGAGGGDSMFAVHSSANKENVRSAIQHAGGELVNIPINARGVYATTFN